MTVGKAGASTALAAEGRPAAAEHIRSVRLQTALPGELALARESRAAGNSSPEPGRPFPCTLYPIPYTVYPKLYTLNRNTGTVSGSSGTSCSREGTLESDGGEGTKGSGAAPA